MPEFRPNQRIRVREEGGDPSSQPDERVLGKEGTIEFGTWSMEGRPAAAYFVQLDSGEVLPISGDWLEPR